MAQGHRHSVVSILSSAELGPAYAAAGICVTWLDMPRSPLRAFAALCRTINRLQPDVVQTWMYHGDVMGGLAARLCGVPRLVWGIRQTSIAMLPADRTLRIMYRLGAWLSHVLPHAVVCNAATARDSHVAYGYSAKRMHVIANGFDTDTFDPAKVDRQIARQTVHGFGSEHTVVGHLARYSPEKDHTTFLHAARLALNADPQLRFVLVGLGLDKHNAVLMDSLRQHDLMAHVELKGQRGDPAMCLRAMDIFCLSSRHEGFPNALGEAMAMGLPCVTTDAGDARVLAGDAATVVPCGDAPALAAAMLAAARLTPSQRQQAGRTARRRIQALFGIEQMREQFESLYLSLPPTLQSDPGTPHVRHRWPATR